MISLESERSTFLEKEPVIGREKMADWCFGTGGTLGAGEALNLDTRTVSPRCFLHCHSISWETAHTG